MDLAQMHRNPSASCSGRRIETLGVTRATRLGRPRNPCSASALPRSTLGAQKGTGLVGTPALLPKPSTLNWRLGALGSSLPPPPSMNADELSVRSAERVKRLTTLVEVRRLYRNCIRAQSLIQLPAPVYQPSVPLESSDEDDGDPDRARERRAQRYEDQLKRAVDIIAEMQLTGDKLKGGLRSLPAGFGAIYQPGTERESEDKVRKVAKQYASLLKERRKRELELLPIPSEQAQVLIDLRNSRYSKRQALDDKQEAANKTARERFEQAEKAAGEIISKSIKPALDKASEKEFVDLVKDSGTYLKGLWMRLNGSGLRSKDALLTLDLPMPVSTRKDSEVTLTQLNLELDNLEQKLQEASKNRETKLRKAGIQGRVQMAMQLKLLDSEVLQLSSKLAVRTLQLEMQYIYNSLEDEALDIVSEVRNPAGITRDGSTNELALLAAEFQLLDEQLTIMATALENSTLSLVNDEVLEKLAAEIPDMRTRVGVPDQRVFGGQGFSLTKTKIQIKESKDKLTEAMVFLFRGVKLLSSDVSSAGRLFWKAARGNTLKPREVSAIRRTAGDVLAFIPFTIILIIPLTPLGHVLIFGFIQRYFPSFFPSQFSVKRQNIMVRYEELGRQLLEAQAQAEAAEEEVELQRARVAVARLTAPDSSTSLRSMALDSVAAMETADEEQLEQAARKVKILEEELDSIRDVDMGDSMTEAEAGTQAGSNFAKRH